MRMAEYESSRMQATGACHAGTEPIVPQSRFACFACAACRSVRLAGSVDGLSSCRIPLENGSPQRVADRFSLGPFRLDRRGVETASPQRVGFAIQLPEKVLFGRGRTQLHHFCDDRVDERHSIFAVARHGKGNEITGHRSDPGAHGCHSGSVISDARTPGSTSPQYSLTQANRPFRVLTKWRPSQPVLFLRVYPLRRWLFHWRGSSTTHHFALR